MKLSKILNLVAVAALVTVSAVGCRKGLQKATPLPNQALATFGDETPKPLIDTTSKTPPNLDAGPVVNPGNISTPLPSDSGPGAVGTALPKPPTVPENSTGLPASTKDLGLWEAAAEQPFRSETVYFEFDKSNVKPSEIPKLQRVANGMKNYQGKAIRVEGHCDERGTEEYNRALGERRALSIREHLVRLGVDANLIDTISYGEDRPADPAHNDAAYEKNRRGEFILLKPPGTP